MILGAGPNRIGQGIEFDYCCVHAAYALARGRVTRPSWSTATPRPSPPTTTPPTSCTSSRSPSRTSWTSWTWRSPTAWWCTLGGQTPLKLANALAEAGVPIMGTEPRGHRPGRGPRPLLRHLLDELGIAYPAAGMASTFEEACVVADRRSAIPLLVRPSYVLGGRGMGIVYDGAQLRELHGRGGRRLARPPRVPGPLPRRRRGGRPGRALRRRGGATWAASWSTSRWRASTRATRPAARRPSRCRRPCTTSCARIARELALRLGVVGLHQHPVRHQGRRSSTSSRPTRAPAARCPSCRKATGVPLAKCAARIMAGEKIADLGLPARRPAPGATTA